MCCARDAAMAMVNMSIDMAEENGEPRYYMDSIKLHKLLYLSQCAMLEVHGYTMFRNDITAHRCGPYVEGIKGIPASRGFGPIKERFDPEKDDFVYPSMARLDILDQTLQSYGTMTTDELIQYTKNSAPYRNAMQRAEGDSKPPITIEDMNAARSQPQAG